jgi:hypothetical protein
MSETFDALAAPFSPSDIHWRVGARTKDKSKGIALAYLDARHVMYRLDEVVGPNGWQCRYPFAGCCELSILVGGKWITKTNCAGETQVEGEKGQASDAFKRAAVLWGVGRYLYALPNVWFAIDQYGKFTKDAEAEMTQRLASWQDRYFQKDAA